MKISIKHNTTKLKNLKKDLKIRNKVHNDIKLQELMTSEFISQHSHYMNLEHLLNESGFIIENLEDWKVVPDEKWNDFIVKNTSFSSWEEMQKEAMTIYIKKLKKQLFKNL